MMIQSIDPETYDFGAGPKGNACIVDLYRTMIMDAEFSDSTDVFYDFFYTVCSFLYAEEFDLTASSDYVIDRIEHFVRLNSLSIWMSMVDNDIVANAAKAEEDAFSDHQKRS